MRSNTYEMDNDPSSSRNQDHEPVDDLSDEVADMEEYADTFFENEEGSEFQNQEISALNNQLDQLQSALDMLESRNADIHDELLQLLQSNREVRRVLIEELGTEGSQPANETVQDATTSSTSMPSVNECPPGVPSLASNSPAGDAISTESVIVDASFVQSIDAIKLEKYPN